LNGLICIGKVEGPNEEILNASAAFAGWLNTFAWSQAIWARRRLKR
jgi:hypothetical protein